jgi:hypothetical protein
LVLGNLFVLLGCQSETTEPREQGEKEEAVRPAELKSGAALAKQYCSSCHLYPEPDLLDKTSWREHVLPPMGYMLGIYPNGERPDSLFESGRAGEIVREAGVYPTEPQLARAEWDRIEQFYLENAPEEPLPMEDPPEIELGLDQFEVRFPDFRVEPPSPPSFTSTPPVHAFLWATTRTTWPRSTSWIGGETPSTSLPSGRPPPACT